MEKVEKSRNAAVHFVVSQLYRCGFKVEMLEGNKRECDVVAHSPTGKRITIDIKGLKNKTNWPIHNLSPRKDHFLVLVSFLDRFSNPASQPDAFIVPSQEIEAHMSRWSGMPSQRSVGYSQLKETKYRNAWNILRSSDL